jgi:flagellar hook protein FlgE
VQGWFAGATGTVNTSGAIGDIVVPVGTLKAAVASTGFSFDMNLDAAAQVNGTFSASIEVYDSLGVSHQVTVDFSKAAANQWDYSISIPQADLQQSQTFQPVTGQLIFDDVGSLDMTQTQPPAAISIQGLASGAATLTLDWQLLNGTVPRLTQYAQSCAISANAQDGSPAAQLTRVALGDGGKILAQYSNGQQIVVGQLAMASIRNPGSLIAVGNNAFQLSARSALPAIGVPGTGGRGLILGGAIEYSNVDIAREFTNLIVLQRGYQANARVVTTVDELSQDTINLKR